MSLPIEIELQPENLKRFRALFSALRMEDLLPEPLPARLQARERNRSGANRTFSILGRG